MHYEEKNGKKGSIDAGLVMFGTGRKPNTDKLNVEVHRGLSCSPKGSEAYTAKCTNQTAACVGRVRCSYLELGSCLPANIALPGLVVYIVPRPLRLHDGQTCPFRWHRGNAVQHIVAD